MKNYIKFLIKVIESQGILYTIIKFNDSTLTRLKIGKVSIVTFHAKQT